MKPTAQDCYEAIEVIEAVLDCAPTSEKAASAVDTLRDFIVNNEPVIRWKYFATTSQGAYVKFGRWFVGIQKPGKVVVFK